MTGKSDRSPLSAAEQAIFNQIASTNEISPVILTVTDGYDPTPRPFELEEGLRNEGLPIGHIAFMGDFES